jgi:hypothetical protein
METNTQTQTLLVASKKAFLFVSFKERQLRINQSAHLLPTLTGYIITALNSGHF